MPVIDAALGSAWAMEEPALRTLLEIASREHQITPQALEAYKAERHEKAEAARVRDGVGILNVEGPLFKRANLMTAYCGATSYDVLMRDFAALVDDSNVRAILLNVDSPGGEAAGCAEFASAVLAARGSKPIVAYAGDLAASAAYWIASAADRIVIGASGAVGSIGVRSTLTDTSSRDARSGVTRFEFVSSQSPFKVSDPKTDDGTARIQARVDSLAQVFVDAVASNRGVSVAHVLDAFGKGDVKIGAAAISAGMADAFGTFESVLADLVTSTDPLALIGLSTAALRGNTPKEEATMPTTEELTAAVQAAKEQAAADQAAAVAAASASATAAAQTAERDRMSGIFAAHVAGYEAERDGAIQSGSSVAEFKALIVDKEHAKLQARGNGIASDVKVNQQVPATTRTEPKPATDDDKAVAAILSAFKAV